MHPKDTRGRPATPAQAAFDAVKKHFDHNDALTSQEKALIKSSTKLEDVQELVAQSLDLYHDRVDSSKIRKGLLDVSEKICHYGNVLDVFVQHHPEYVSIAWGTMKLLFAGVMNHGETLTTLTKVITQAADRLPRINILSSLYPSEQMESAVENLYSCILEFLLKAYGWTKESKFRHLYHSITRPPALQYGDLLSRITEWSNIITELATVGSQAEIRTMYEAHGSKLDSVLRTVQSIDREHKVQLDSLTRSVSRLEKLGKDQELKTTIILASLEASGLTINDLVMKIEVLHSLQTSAHLDTNQGLSDLQISQAMSTFSPSHVSPGIIYKKHLFHRSRRSVGIGRKTSTNEFWLSPKLNQFASSRTSAIISVRGPLSSRSALQDFGVDIISTLKASYAPILWALTESPTLGRGRARRTVDMLKCLTWQALQLPGVMRNEKQMASRCSQFQSSQMVGDWVKLFMHVISELTAPLYLVIDLAAAHSMSGGSDLNMVQVLSSLIREIAARGQCPPVKIILLAYEAEWYRPLSMELAQSVVLVRTVKSKPQQSRNMRNHIQRGQFRRANLARR